MANLTTMQSVDLGVTPGGKRIVLAKVKNGNKIVRQIQFVGGGEVPEELHGIFTDTRMAQVAVTVYLEKMAKEQAKKEEAAKNRSKTGQNGAANKKPPVKPDAVKQDETAKS